MLLEEVIEDVPGLIFLDEDEEAGEDDTCVVLVLTSVPFECCIGFELLLLLLTFLLVFSKDFKSLDEEEDEDPDDDTDAPEDWDVDNDCVASSAVLLLPFVV